jgi:hypothetical protein
LQDIQIMTMHSKALSWSLLGPTPVLFYNDQADAYGVAWNGIFMGHKQAIQLASFISFKIATTPRARRFALIEFNKLYKCNAFGEQKWGDTPDNWGFLCSHFSRPGYIGTSSFNAIKEITPQQLFEWFSESNAIA